MNIEINSFFDFSPIDSKKQNIAGDGLFRKAVEDAVAEHEASARFPACSGITRGYAVISPDLEAKILQDPELAEQIAKKISDIQKSLGEKCSNDIIIADKNGGITHYCMKENDKDSPSAEELKEIAKARARKKARLDAYFRLLERLSIKRKLIEQENAKRAFNKKYRYSVSKLNCIAQSYLLSPPPKNPEYYF